jgi:hypothetical protein
MANSYDNLRQLILLEELAGSDFSVLKGLAAVESECLLVAMLIGLFEVVE